jgi:hypothetical protein
MLLVSSLTAAVAYVEESFATHDDIDEPMKLGCGGHPADLLRLHRLGTCDAVCDSP